MVRWETRKAISQKHWGLGPCTCSPSALPSKTQELEPRPLWLEVPSARALSPSWWTFGRSARFLQAGWGSACLEQPGSCAWSTSQMDCSASGWCKLRFSQEEAAVVILLPLQLTWVFLTCGSSGRKKSRDARGGFCMLVHLACAWCWLVTVDLGCS